jgi:hypothetical protein
MPSRPDFNTEYVIVNRQTGTVLDLDRGRSSNGTSIYGYQVYGTRNPSNPIPTNRRWRILSLNTGNMSDPVIIQNVGTGTVLDLDCRTGANNGNRLLGWTMGIQPLKNNQLWHIVESITENGYFSPVAKSLILGLIGLKSSVMR